MNATTTDEAALMASIIAHPEEDMPRLMLADVLDGLGDERVPCPKCEGKGQEYAMRECKDGIYRNAWADCPKCNGTGSVLDTSRSDRAELIRVQCELTRHKCIWCENKGTLLGTAGDKRNPDCDCGINALRARESALIAENRERWLPECAACRGKGRVYNRNPNETELCNHCNGDGYVGTLERGFACEVPVPTIASVLTVNEEFTGDTVAVGRMHFPLPDARWKPIYSPTKYAREELYAKFPTLLRIVPKDRVPCNRLRNISHPFPERCVAWDKPAAGLPLSHRTHWIPEIVFDAMEKTEFDTPDAACLALSTALRAAVWAKIKEGRR